MAIGLMNALRERRLERGWTQARLARDAGISRQAYAAIESGASVPSTEVALRLARALGVGVEALFRLRDAARRVVRADLVGPPSLPLPSRVALARVAGRLLARPVVSTGGAGVTTANGIARSVSADGRVEVELLERSPRGAIVVLGGDPTFGMLARGLARERGIELQWWPMGSSAALEALACGEAHIVGVHLLDEATGEYNTSLPVRLPFSVRRVGFATREQVLMVAAGNPRGIGGVADLARPDLRFINREPGSGSRLLMDRHLAAARVDPASVPGYTATSARNHVAVAESVAAGTADAGIGIRGIATAFGLGGVTLGEERYDLVVPDHFLDLSGVQVLLDELRRRPFRAQVESMGGYDVAPMGLPA